MAFGSRLDRLEQARRVAERERFRDKVRAMTDAELAEQLDTLPPDIRGWLHARTDAELEALALDRLEPPAFVREYFSLADTEGV